MTVVQAISDVLSGLVTLLIDLLVDTFSGVVTIFYDATTGFTIYGVFLLIGMSLMIVMLAITFIRSLISRQ